jgi:hypothetical protein
LAEAGDFVATIVVGAPGFHEACVTEVTDVATDGGLRNANCGLIESTGRDKTGVSVVNRPEDGDGRTVRVESLEDGLEFVSEVNRTRSLTSCGSAVSLAGVANAGGQLVGVECEQLPLH